LTKLTKNRKYPKNPEVIVSVFISRGSDFPGAFDHQAAIQALREIAVLQDISLPGGNWCEGRSAIMFGLHGRA
jgi:hypothetical protein